jgi:hypothetical protein
MPIENRREKRAIKMADFEILRETASRGRDAFCPSAPKVGAR